MGEGTKVGTQIRRRQVAAEAIRWTGDNRAEIEAFVDGRRWVGYSPSG